MPERGEVFEREKFERLPAEAVEVIYENDRVNLPFRAKDLAVFLEPKQGSVSLGVRGAHHRSAEIPAHLMVGEAPSPWGKHQEKNLFFTVDLKGTGFLHPQSYVSKKEWIHGVPGAKEVHVKKPAVEMSWGYDVLGLMDERSFHDARRMTEEFQRLGARTETFVAAMRIQQLYYDGALRRVPDLQNDDVLPRDPEWHPVIAVRLMRCKTRIQDFVGASVEVRQDMLADAFRVLNLEAKKQGRDIRFDATDPDSVRQYLLQIAKWHAKNLAILHDVGRVHHFLNSHNLTLAGEMVDLDSVSPAVVQMRYQEAPRVPSHETHQSWDAQFKIPRILLKDIRDFAFAFKDQVAALREVVPLGADAGAAVAEAFMEAYGHALSQKPEVEHLGFPRARLVEVVREVIEDHLVRGKAMRPIATDEKLAVKN